MERNQWAWYKFNSEGYILTNEWIAQDDTWYWLKSDGAMAKGWQFIHGKWYFFHEDGSMHEGWLEYYDKWYYLNLSDGDMLECANITVDENAKIQF
ncbi:hypothetical protein [Granulicatella elegans]|uniref:hypothetical protein n=1 Tax=Granulicatella elegans TaxID=137732 RepID=UPI001D1427F0|nr:hypothetical protein [Granulicatella elegans]UEA31371.1 hypothetical protein LK443_08995 [Granulicatella elegans]